MGNREHDTNLVKEIKNLEKRSSLLTIIFRGLADEQVLKLCSTIREKDESFDSSDLLCMYQEAKTVK